MLALGPMQISNPAVLAAEVRRKEEVPNCGMLITVRPLPPS